jgi:hypothetical protein
MCDCYGDRSRAAYKCITAGNIFPIGLLIADSLPRTSGEKWNKQELREQFWSGRERKVN